ncbi:hypothetical protein AB0K80_03710 [Streptomyces sp. NPDC052682]|uniref:hypothetical protein n=1 Tax=Streptomyces sp. NPDC052682 TaxID=3154954 RepID=UPI00342D44F2
MPELTPDALRDAVARIARAARLQELERIVDAGEQEPSEALAEIHAIREAAEAEAEAGL